MVICFYVLLICLSALLASVDHSTNGDYQAKTTHGDALLTFPLDFSKTNRDCQ